MEGEWTATLFVGVLTGVLVTEAVRLMMLDPLGLGVTSCPDGLQGNCSQLAVPSCCAVGMFGCVGWRWKLEVNLGRRNSGVT